MESNTEPIAIPTQPPQNHNAELAELRNELLRRLDAHPVARWSPALLTATISVLDLAGREVPLKARQRSLRIVR